MQEGTVVACDRYFTTLSLAIALLNVKKWLVGTMQTNRKGFPRDLDVGKHTDMHTLCTMLTIRNKP